MKRIRLFLIAVILLLIAGFASGCVVFNEAGAFFAARDMRATLANAEELIPSENIAAGYYGHIVGSEYDALNEALKSFEKEQKMEVSRLFAVKGGKCFFAAVSEDSKACEVSYLYSIDIDGKDHELICAFNEGNKRWLDCLDYDFGILAIGIQPAYSKLPAYYYGGKIVINDSDSVIEYDIESGNITKCAAGDYEHPKKGSSISYTENDLRVRLNEEEYRIPYQELIDSSPEMKYLYDLTKQQRADTEPDYSPGDFFSYHVYYDGEPYFVCRPMSKYGLSFGALFKFDPDTQKLTYINCVYTDDLPYGVYPIFVGE